jgi:hypothetical protein
MRQNFRFAVSANDGIFGFDRVMNSGSVSSCLGVALSGYWHKFIFINDLQ